MLPLSVAALFARAAAGGAGGELAWTSARGRPYRVRVCPVVGGGPAVEGAGALTPASRGDAFATGDMPAAPRRVAVTDWSAGRAAAPSGGAAAAGERALGALVHRLFQHGGGLEGPAVEALAVDLAGDDEIDPAGRAGLAARAAAAYLSLRARDDVRALLDSGERLYEVPFSLWLPPGTGTDAGRPPLLRGTIDCLVLTPGRAVIVVELKTGRPRPEHDAQLELYVTAARALFPGRAVRGQLIYP